MTNQQFDYYFEIVVTGSGERAKFHTNATPPRVGELVNVDAIIPLSGYHRVLQVKHYYLQQKIPSGIFEVVEILIEEKEAEEVNWLG